jgi:hypothetical protein
MSKVLKNRARGYFHLNEKYLYVANDGNPFDREGIIALCNTNLSGKGDKVYDDHKDIKDEISWLQAYNESQSQFYVKNKNRLTTDHKEEVSTIDQYSGRWLLEMLQNIDDAIGPIETSRFIGTKGLGFLSILEVAKEPNIFSGPFFFKFSKENTAKYLLEKGIDDKPAHSAPSLFVPWRTKPDEITKDILSQGYATVIRFQLNDDRYNDVKGLLYNFDHHFLLFSQNLRSITIEIGKYKKKVERAEELLSKSEESSKFKLTLTSNQNGEKTKIDEWIRWQRHWESSEELKKRSSSMFCLPLKNGVCTHYKRNNKIYNFFPTDESSSIRGLLHVSFNLSRDRKKLMMWGPQDASWKGKKVHPENIKLVKETIKLITEDVIDDKLVPAETVIKTFLGLNKYKNEPSVNGKPLKHIQKELLRVIKSYSFIPIFGGKTECISNINLWDHDLLDSLVDTEKVTTCCLASNSMLPFFKNLQEYDCKIIDLSDLLIVLSKNELKNKSKKEREKILRLISNYNTSDIHINFHDVAKFASLPILEDKQGEIVSLNDDYYVSSDNIKTLSFLKSRFLDKSTHKNLQKYFLDKELDYCYLADEIEKRLIKSDKDYFDRNLSNLLEDADESFWEKNGFEILAYLYNFFINHKDHLINNSDNFNIFAPELNTNIWKDITNSYFSKNWFKKPHLSNWYAEHSFISDFEIISIKTFKKKISEFTSFSSTKKNELIKAFSQENFMEFLCVLGVSKVPKIINTNYMPEDYRFSRFPGGDTYYKLLSNNDFKTRNTEYYYEGLETFILNQTKKELLINIYRMNNDALKKRAEYRKFRKKTDENLRDHRNFASFQLKNLKWITLNKSPISASGQFAPSECFISDKKDNLFPSLSNKYFDNILNKNQVEKLISTMGFNKGIPTGDNWVSWFKSIQTNYRILSDNKVDIKKLNAQVDYFFTEFLNFNQVKLLDTAHIPIKPYENEDLLYKFMPRNKVVWNDTPLEDDLLNSFLKKYDFGLFILGNLNGLKDPLLGNNACDAYTERFNIIPEPVRIEKDFEKDIKAFFKQKWSILSALDNDFRNTKTSKQFSEFESRVNICESLSVELSKNDLNSNDNSETHPILFFEEFSTNAAPNTGNIFILYDETYGNILRYICNYFFNWTGRYELVKALFSAGTEIEFKEILSDNKLDKNLINDFKFIHSDNEEDKRKEELEKIHSEHLEKKKAEELEKTFQEVADKFSGHSRKNQKIQNELKEKEPKESTNSIKNTDKKIQPTNSLEKSREKRLQSSRQIKFGTRKSGHLRVRHSTETIGRKYFDEESSPENKRIGDRAEKIVLDKLKKNNAIKDLNLLGGNNKGFDIEYKKNETPYFVEVKGLIGSWEDTDVLLSRSQFEKAQLEKDRYSIYIVEHVDDETKRNTTVIIDPASYFTKMQLDHGWKNFSVPDKLKPSVGSLLVEGDKKSIITGVDKRGDIYQLSLKGKITKTLFNSQKMHIEENKEN